MKTVLYARVSTIEQTIEHQRVQAEQAGFKFDEVVEDLGVSGVSIPLKDRPGGRRLFDLLREGDTLVVRWVDRLGRDYRDVSDNIREFMRKGVIVRTIINGLKFDGTDSSPMAQAVRDALIGFMAASAQAQAEAVKDAQRAGIAHARQINPSAYRGRRPTVDERQVAEVFARLQSGESATEIAKALGVGRSTVYRIKEHPESMLEAARKWAS